MVFVCEVVKLLTVKLNVPLILVAVFSEIVNAPVSEVYRRLLNLQVDAKSRLKGPLKLCVPTPRALEILNPTLSPFVLEPTIL